MGRLVLVTEGGGENPLRQIPQFLPMEEWNRIPIAPWAFGSLDSADLDPTSGMVMALHTSGYQGSQIVLNPWNPANVPGLPASQLNPFVVPPIGVTRYGV